MQLTHSHASLPTEDAQASYLRRRDPTVSNDLRRRLQTQLRLALNSWRRQTYQAIVGNDLFGYDTGFLNSSSNTEELAQSLEALLRRQAHSALIPAYDQLEINLRTAYGRGVDRALRELGQGVPFPTSQEVLDKAYREFDNILDSQIDQTLDRLRLDPGPALRSRHQLYNRVLLPGLFRPLSRRFNMLAVTNVTTSYVAGKLDSYEAAGIQRVGVEPETLLPVRRERRAKASKEPVERKERKPAPEYQPKAFRTPVRLSGPAFMLPRTSGRHKHRYTVATQQDERVCPVCNSYEGQSYTLAQVRRLIPAHPSCRCSVMLLS